MLRLFGFCHRQSKIHLSVDDPFDGIYLGFFHDENIDEMM